MSFLGNVILLFYNIVKYKKQTQHQIKTRFLVFSAYDENILVGWSTLEEQSLWYYAIYY